MQDNDPRDPGQGEIVSGPEPSRLPKAVDVVAAFKGLFASRAYAAEDAKFVFLFLTATLFGPETRRRINWQQGGPG